MVLAAARSVSVFAKGKQGGTGGSLVAPQMHPRRTHRAAWTWFAALVSGRGGIRLRLYECSAPHEYKRTVQRNSTSLRLGGLFCSGRGATGALANGPRQGIEIERFSQVGCVLVSEDLLDL